MNHAYVMREGYTAQPVTALSIDDRSVGNDGILARVGSSN